jgi:hypothetical protein
MTGRGCQRVAERCQAYRRGCVGGLLQRGEPCSSPVPARAREHDPEAVR